MILKLVILNLFYLILYHAHKDITQACTFYVIKFTPFYDNNTMYLTPNLVNYLFSMNSYNYCFQMKRNRPVYVLYNSPLLWQLTFKAIIWLRLAFIVCYLSDVSSIQTSCLLDQGKSNKGIWFVIVNIWQCYYYSCIRLYGVNFIAYLSAGNAYSF